MTIKSTVFDSSCTANNTSVDEHICFTEEMIYKYDWNPADRIDFESRLFKIKAKQQDKCLNLSIVGEFGTGKSTLINALLRNDEFLVSSALQGTTVAATVVEDAPIHAIFLEHLNGQQEYKVFDSITSLRDGLIAYTTDPEIARSLYNVRIRIPSEHLSTGFRIIDTPGLNANEKWHEKVTLRAIEEMSDMSVLIIDANKPLTGSFCDFIKTTLSKELEQCVFLVTRIDMIRKRERQGVLDYLKVKVAKEFSLPEPIVLPYASMAVLDEIHSEPTELSEMSHQTESALFIHMKEKKEITQRKKLESLVDDMYRSLSDRLNKLSDSYKEELDKLIRNRQVDLKPFVREQISIRCAAFEEAALEIHMNIIDNLEMFANRAHLRIFQEIDAQYSTAALKKFIANNLSDRCIFAAQSIVNESAKECTSLQNLFKTQMKIFYSEFEAKFKDFDILRDEIHVNLFENISFSSLDLSDLDMSKGAFSKLSWLLGPVIASTTNLYSVTAVKTTVREHLYDSLKGFFGDVINNIATGIQTYIQELKSSISKEINKHLDAYQESISRLICLEEQNIASIKEKTTEVQQDMENVALRKKSLNTLRKDVTL